MRTNLSSQISLNRVSPKYYKPENAVERSVLTRCEKVPTDIYETMEEGVQQIANEITAKIQERQREGKFCVIGAGTGASLRPLYAELVRKHKDEGLSFRNVVIFNLYEYYPLASEGAGSSFSQLNDLFLSQIDIDKQNVFTIDGTIPQEAVIEYCRLYEQRIQTFGGIDIVLMGIGRGQLGNQCRRAGHTAKDKVVGKFEEIHPHRHHANAERDDRILPYYFHPFAFHGWFLSAGFPAFLLHGNYNTKSAVCHPLPRRV